MKEDSRLKTIYRVTMVGLAVNVLLALVKLAAGYIGRSEAMVADAFHSVSDLATDVVVIAFARLASKPQDESHDYGHGKYETLATMLIAVALLGLGVMILVESLRAILFVTRGGVLPRPETYVPVVALVSVVVKELLYRYTDRAGRKIDSAAVRANAWHHRSDALTSVGTLIGISAASFLGEPWRVADPIAASVVSVFIFKIGLDLLVPALQEMLEKSLPRETEEEILRIVTADRAVCDPHHLRTRRIGAAISIEIHIRVDGGMSVREAHVLTVDMEHRLKARFGAQTFIAIHIEPRK